MAEKRLARCNVVAEFDALDAATDALDELRDAGLTSDELSLLGPDVEKAPGSDHLAESSATQATSGVGRKAVAGIGTGTVVGAGLGALAGAAVSAVPGVGLAVGAGALYAAIAGGATGQIAGGLLGAEAGARKSMMWAQSLQPLMTRVSEEGRLLVGVHSDDASRIDRAQETLEGLDPLAVHRMDADKAFRPPGDAAALRGRTVPSSVPDEPGGQVADEDDSD